jgi:hypothetical protein
MYCRYKYIFFVLFVLSVLRYPAVVNLSDRICDVEQYKSLFLAELIQNHISIVFIEHFRSKI